MVRHNSELSVVVDVKSNEHPDQALMELKESALGKLNESFSLEGNGLFRYQGRLCVLNIDGLMSRILEEAHGSCYPIRLGSTKMYRYVRELFW